MRDASELDEPTRGADQLAAGRVGEALVLLRRAVERDPSDVAARANLAQALRAHGDRGLALAHARAAASLDPSCPVIQRLVATTLMLVGDVEGALPGLRRSLAAGGGPLSRFALAVALRSRGDAAEALAQLQRARDEAAALGLAPLVQARIAGVLADVERDSTPAHPLDLCSVPIVTEILARAPRMSEPPPLRERSDTPRIVALTGAGISRSSGLATRKELWRHHSRDDAVGIWRFHEQPELLWRVIAEFLGEHEPRPSPAHLALARLPGLAAVLTQNVDGLHQAAAHARGVAHPIVELHGTLARSRCHACGCASESARELLRRGEPVPRCACGGALRPDVVLFGEPVPAADLELAVDHVQRCDVLLVVGCAMDVAPAADLPRLARAAGARVIEIKRNPSRITTTLATELLRGPADERLPDYLDALQRGIEP
jgi:NAD-dependent deacetylase